MKIAWRKRKPEDPAHDEQSRRRFAAAAASVTPREGQPKRNWEALHEQARAALAHDMPNAPPPQSPPTARPPQTPDSVIRVHLWPR